MRETEMITIAAAAVICAVLAVYMLGCMAIAAAGMTQEEQENEGKGK
jgi:hypothetical protein